jgi:hypothetical protein
MNKSVKKRILLAGASGTHGRNFLELDGNDPSIQILALLSKESKIFAERLCGVVRRTLA